MKVLRKKPHALLPFAAGANSAPYRRGAEASESAQAEVVKTDHLYTIGEEVTYVSEATSVLKTGGQYMIIARMPPLGDVLQYRIKRNSEPFERVVLEHQLSPYDLDR